MAAVHFTTIPYEPNTAYKKAKLLQYLSPTLKTLCRKFEDFVTYLYVFMNVVKCFVR